jgi:hypothetical protein
MKKIICALLLLSLLFVNKISGLSVYASEIDEELGEVVMVAVPDGNGKLNYYSGDDAKKVYTQIMQQSDKILEEFNELEKVDKSFELPEIDVDPEIEPYGPFHYRYRFIKESSGQIYGTSKRISNYLENSTSERQNLSTSVRSSTTWTINTALTGGFKDAFNLSVGGSWSTNSSFSQTITMNVGPNKKMWLEFRPLIRYVSGKAQKYYIPRGPITKRAIVVESKSVYSTSPETVYMKLGGKSFMATDGAYVWREISLR